MAIKNNKSLQSGKKVEFEITEKGSLGILALGDIGLRAWRIARQEFHKRNSE